MTELRAINQPLVDPVYDNKIIHTHPRKSFHSFRSDIKFEVKDNADVVSVLTRVCIICTMFMLVELVGGYWANSVAVISDALHLSIDIVGYIIQITSAVLATKKSTKTMNFGYFRFEPIGAILNCFTIWALTIYLVVESYERIRHPPKHFEPFIMLITATFGVIANVSMAAVIHGPGIIMTMLKYPFMSAEEKDNMHIKEGKENLNIRTVMAHINGDLVYSVGVLLGAIAININQDWKILDPLLTILFSFVVLHITVPVFTDSMSAVMEASPSEEEYNEIATAITSTPGVKKVYSLRVWSLTQDQRCAAVHLSLEEGQEEQKLQHEIGKRLQEKDISFWAIQVWKPSWKYQCCFDDEFSQSTK